MTWYEVKAWCEAGPFRLLTDSEDEAKDWAAAQEKKFGCKQSIIIEHDEEDDDEFETICNI